MCRIVPQERVLRRLLVEGRSASEIAGMRLGEVDLGDEDGREYLEKRNQLGISVEPGEPLAVLPNGIDLERFAFTGPHRVSTVHPSRRSFDRWAAYRRTPNVPVSRNRTASSAAICSAGVSTPSNTNTTA